MSTHTVLAIALFSALVGCGGADADGDGLTDKEERTLGTDVDLADTDGDGLFDGQEMGLGADPMVADSDGDGLLDGEEVALGSDPVNADSDGDGYGDGDEVAAGSNPGSADSVIYEGGWPYNAGKDGLPGEEDWRGQELSVGTVVPAHFGDDQFGDEVNLHDFAGQGKYTIIDSSAEWCDPCKATSLWLSGGADLMGLEGSYGDVRAAVDSGDIQWVTILAQDRYGSIARGDTISDWDAAYPHEKVPVIVDDGRHFYYGVNIEGNYEQFPSGLLLDENFEVVARGGMSQVLGAARNLLDDRD